MNKLLTGIFMIVLITISSLALLAAPKATAQNETWPWGTASEPYPWLEYLKSLPHDTNITLIIITRHEATITEKV
ncbi:MAG: ABC transporter substrate-binding protein, partial [Desulfurococcales archaeon]|nr:ABC transporter substrate-binding protein [Desulfurococcales archaeon]